jgi:hypothetical protein
MKRLLSVLFFTLAIVTLVPQGAAAREVSVSPVAVAHYRAKAPADEYFGQLRMSILGVRNVVNDIDIRAEGAADDAARGMCRKLVLAEDALRDWQAKYPDDAWIPRLGYAMLKGYEKVDSVIIADDSNVASVHAIDLAVWLDVTYPNSEFAPR